VIQVTDSEKQKHEFPVTGRNRARLRRDRASYDADLVYELLDSSLICHIAYVIDGQPYCTPTIFWRRGNDVIWHGGAGGKMLKAQAKGIDVCLTVSFIDGLVLTRSAFHHSVNYRSAMLFGRASLIDDPDERKREADELIENFLPDRNGLLIPPTPAEMKQAAFLKMPIDEAVAKIRVTAASYEGDENRDHPVWAGEIPLTTRIGAVVPCVSLDPAVAPSPDLAWYKEGARLDSTLLEIRRRARGSAY
jgi:nitroimidazol reductase NimA-like FMN-containing flavoprotein (pyridoxamine 5'-phosphate oxidase superfamily)